MAAPISRNSAVYIAGHHGLVGSALTRRLKADGFTNILGATRRQLDLRDQAAVNYWFKANNPEYVFLVAGTVGGILANSTRPAEFIYDNLMIHATVVEASRLSGVKRLLYLGSSCIYRSPRTDQRFLRTGKDFGHPPVPVLSSAVRLRLHLGHAHQPLRSRG
jgi:GDP-L-fucose synthase